ncbi:outer membrane protein transport protein [Echinicola sediminis]
MAGVQAQSFDDALRYSYFNASGSARIMALGGSQYALGGDISNISGNPAGLGFFRKSEFSFSTSYENWQSNSTFLNQPQSDTKGNFALPNLSIVINKTKDPLNTDNWRGHSFGISINRLTNFNNTFGYFSDIEGNSSLLDFYANDYNQFGAPGVGDPAGLPLDVGLVVLDNGSYYPTEYSYDPNQDGSPNFDSPIPPFHDELIETEGNMTQISFAYGTNYKNKLFIGGSLGLTSIDYTSFKTFNEEFIDNNGNTSLYYSLRENLFHNGTGINLNLGMIYKPVDQLNLGLSYSSPTWTRYEEEFDADLLAEYYDLDGNFDFDEFAQSDIYFSAINLRSPMKVSGGAAFFFNKSGFITADVDYIDYSSMHLSSPDFGLDAANDQISELAGSALNYRAGAEYRIKLFRLRAGAAYYGDPYENSGLDRSKTQFTGGVGVKLPKMYIDLGLVHSQFDSFYTSYPGADLVSIDNKSTRGLLTVGFSF